MEIGTPNNVKISDIMSLPNKADVALRYPILVSLKPTTIDAFLELK
ncbi:MAG: hypothetical protein MjAS7_2614 [Metallosphaera javensis (ex Sakai et al. 2022)]|nr:MAG: hypothetical protein MjAS7_2614 [Metallosphaera javensis (ex Sakai et al. 2022)]